LMSGNVWYVAEFVAPGATVQHMRTTISQGFIEDKIQELLRRGDDVRPLMNLNGQTTMAPPIQSVPPISTTPIPNTPAGVTPEARALQLLNGNNAATFYQTALPDPIIRQDANLVNTISSEAFLASMISQGKVVLNPDKTYTVK
jgi:hypothetical protein